VRDRPPEDRTSLGRSVGLPRRVRNGILALTSGNCFLDRSARNIGSFLLDDLPKNLPMGSEIDVTFAHDLNGIVEISARDRKSGKTEKSRFDVNRLSEVPPGADRADREKCERILRSARKKLGRIGDDAESRKEIEQKADLLEKSLAGDGDDALKLALELAEMIAGI